MRAHLSPDIFIFEAISVISKSSVRKPSRVGMMLAGWNEPHVIRNAPSSQKRNAPSPQKRNAPSPQKRNAPNPQFLSED